MKLMLYDDAGHPVCFAPVEFDDAGGLKSLMTSGAGAPTTTGLTHAALYLDVLTNNLWAWNTQGSNWQQLTGN